MADRALTEPELLAEVPRDLRARIISGMRWTLWLSVLAAPFGFGSSALLARVGPEAIGTYGVLTLYIGVVSGLFYLGGDAVLIKFLPEMNVTERGPFLVSYFGVTLAALVPWLGTALLWPQALKYVFGDRISGGFAFLALAAAPIYIAYSMVAAALKAELELRLAKVLLRGITVVSFCCYCTLFLVAPSLLHAHSRELIWGLYFLLAAAAACLGARRLKRVHSRNVSFPDLRLTLPRGFWKFTLSLQQQSVLSLISTRIDYILVLNLGGMAELGQYVAIMTLAQIVSMTSAYFAEPLLPAIVNVLARGDHKAASEVFSTTLRILFAVNAAAVFGIIFFMDSLLGLLGPVYAHLRMPCIVMVALLGISAPGASGGTLLASVGRPQRAVWVVLSKIAIFIVLFPVLWEHWRLLGAAIAYGLAKAFEGISLLITARYSTPVRFRGFRDYALLIALTALVAWQGVSGAALAKSGAFLLWVASLLTFLWSAGYRLPECANLLACFVPYAPLRAWAGSTTSRQAAGRSHG